MDGVKRLKRQDSSGICEMCSAILWRSLGCDVFSLRLHLGEDKKNAQHGGEIQQLEKLEISECFIVVKLSPKEWVIYYMPLYSGQSKD